MILCNMAAFDDDNDPATGSQDEDENEDEEMEDVNEANHEDDQDMDAGGDDDDEDEGDDDNDDDNEDEDDEDKNEPESPSQRASQHTATRGAADEEGAKQSVVVASNSPRTSSGRSPGSSGVSWIPPTRSLALTAQAYDIVPTMAAPQGTSINAITATPDMHYVFSGGTDGYVRMYNWVDTANGKVPLTVAQKHPFVDSVMKAGSLITYWENEESNYLKTPPSQPDEGKWTSPVYSLAVQHQALWLLSGLESGGINIQTCRHQAGTRITTLKEHTSAVSVLQLSRDETSVLSGSWDKNIHDWDLNSGKVKRSFKMSGSQIGAIEVRPTSDLAVPEVTETQPDLPSDTFSSNNADKPTQNGSMSLNQSRRQSGKGDEDAPGSPEGSLFGEGDHGSLFGEDPAGGAGGGNSFGDDDDDLTKALEDEMQGSEKGAASDMDTALMNASNGDAAIPACASEDIIPELAEAAWQPEQRNEEGASGSTDLHANGIVTNGLPHSDEPLTAPPTNEDQQYSVADLPTQSESTFLDAAIDGTLRIWDRRVQQPVAAIQPVGSTPPWATGACWSPDGNFFYVGRRNCTVDEYSIHHLGSKRSEANRNFKFQQGSGPVYAVRAMPNKKHLVW